MEPNEFSELGNEEPTLEPQPVIETLSPEDRHQYLIEKVKLKNKLLRYKELFPHLLQSFDLSVEELNKLEPKELNYLLEEISVAVNTRNSSGLTKMLYFESIRIVETGSKIIGLQVNGLQQALKDNQAVHDVLNEISLKYENDMYMAPEIRLAYLTSTAILQLHKLNSSSNVITSFLNQPVTEEIKNEFKDL